MVPETRKSVALMLQLCVMGIKVPEYVRKEGEKIGSISKSSRRPVWTENNGVNKPVIRCWCRWKISHSLMLEGGVSTAGRKDEWFGWG